MLPPDPQDGRIYDLNPLRQKSFHFVFDVGSGIQNVMIKKLRLSSKVTKGDRITLEADVSGNPDAVYDLLGKIDKSLPLHLDNVTQVEFAASAKVLQDAREVNTKFSKTFPTFFFPVGDEIRAIVADWVTYLREEKQWGNDDPLFPATRIAVGTAHQFEASGLERKHWSSASPIRKLFREVFASAELPYFNPHSFRNTLARLGQEVCKTPEEYKAWSQNLGHEQVLTTFLSYGEVACQRQGEIIRGLANPQQAGESDVHDLAELLIRIARHWSGYAS